jgi:hypothetical protein
LRPASRSTSARFRVSFGGLSLFLGGFWAIFGVFSLFSGGFWGCFAKFPPIFSILPHFAYLGSSFLLKYLVYLVYCEAFGANKRVGGGIAPRRRKKTKR